MRDDRNNGAAYVRESLRTNGQSQDAGIRLSLLALLALLTQPARTHS